MPFILFDHKPLFFVLRRSERARRLHMIAKASLFEVVAPQGVLNQVIIRFVQQQRRWMVKQSPKQNQHSLSPAPWLAGEKIPYRGKQLVLLVRYGSESAIVADEERLMISLPWHIDCAQVENEIKRQLLAWYQQQAMAQIEACLAYFCPLLGRWPQSVQLKQQKSRWGSCGATQKIYINWLLILAPEKILEYVVLHELSHLFHRNHGPRFWAKVAKIMPDFKERDRWLNRHGQSLKLQI